MDLLILLLLVGSVLRGLQAGLLELFLSFTGLLIGFLLGSRLAQLIAVHFSSPLSKLAIILIIEFGLAVAFWMVGLELSRRLKPHAVKLRLGKLNEVAGGVMNVIFSLVIIWLVASGLSNVRSYDLGQSVRQSFIISQINKTLPPPPDFIAQLEKIISPNGFPDVFLGLEPTHTTISPKNSVNNQAVLAAEQSVVKVQGIGCGEIIFGSGFVAAKNLIVTNAHVVAGVRHPQVVDSTKTYQATPVWFDPRLDIAILRVNNLLDPPLKISNQVLPDASAAAILGFPKGGELVAEDGAIIDHVIAIGRNIYNEGIVHRQVYEVQADVEQGDSGGPLLAPDGSVVGVTFARAVSQNNIGYALLISQVDSALSGAKQTQTAVDTGSCAS